MDYVTSFIPYPNPRVQITSASPIDEALNNNGTQGSPSRDTLAENLAREHPVYQEYKSQWMDWYNWYTGNHIEDYIYQHVRERPEAYGRRKKRAYYFNYVSSILDLIGSFLFSRAITRSFSEKARDVKEDSEEDDADTEFLKNCDLKGTSLNDFMRMAFNYTKIFAYVDVMVDVPYTPVEILTEQERIDLGMRPYTYFVLPTQMHNWEVDKEGNFIWVRWHEPVDRQYDPFGTPEPTNVVRYVTWTADAWYIHEVTYLHGNPVSTVLVESQGHDLGVVPCVRFFGKKDLLCNTMGKSLVAVMGKINVAIANYVSLVEEEIYAKTLNILAFEDPDDEGLDDVGGSSPHGKKGMEIGNNNVVFYGKGTNPPVYVAPESAPGEFIIAFIKHCVTEIYRVATLGSDTGVDQTKSGAAYCLARGTLIDCPRDLSQYPDGIPIEDLVGSEPFYIYCRLNGLPALCLARKAWQSGSQVRVYRVNYEWFGYGRWYDGSITATANHRFMLRDGTYCQLRNLDIGDRLMPFGRSINGRGNRPTVSGPGMEREYEHRFIMRQVLGEDFDETLDVHHINHNKMDNRVENLEVMDTSSHTSYHAHENVERIREGAQKRIADGNGRWLEFTEEEILEALQYAQWRPTYAAEKLGISFITLKRKMALHGITIPNNHRVTSIEFVGYEDVYDIEVPHARNFVANGIVVHNSYEFNETNRMLADNADLMQEGEEKVHALRARWLGKDYKGYVDYPDSFDIGSYSDELQATVDAKAAIRSPTFGKELEKRFARRMLERSSAAVADKIMQEIDTLPEKTVIYQTQMGPKKGANPGQPGVEGGSDTDE